MDSIAMKALSVKQPWASMIASGQKTIETRTWASDYRGDLLIVSSRQPRIAPAGFALALVRIVDCHRMTNDDEAAACCAVYPGAYAWVLADIRRIRHFPVKGQLGIFQVTVPHSELVIESRAGEGELKKFRSMPESVTAPTGMRPGKK